MRVLVTGNLGYLGMVVTTALLEAGHEIVGFDTDYYRDGYFGERAQLTAGRFSQICKDVREVEAADLAGVEAVVHLAALSNDPTGELDPVLTAAINHRATVRLAQLARSSGVSRFLFSSSCSIYGQGTGTALTEEAGFNPQTAYARSKVAAEADVAALATGGFSPVFLRNGTAYGLSRKLRLDLVVNNLTAWAFTTGLVKLLSDGRAWRPIVHVEDIAQAFRVALEAPREAIHNQAFNVGSNEQNFQVRAIADHVAAIVPGCQVVFGEGASADSRTYHVSFAKIRRKLSDFRPVWTLESGIQQLYEAFRSARLSSDEFQGRNYMRLKQLQHLLQTQQVDAALRWRDMNRGDAS
jgi:nucleoside-diphosphate-sugar epimerase